MTYIEFEREIIKELFRKYNIFMIVCGEHYYFYEKEVDEKWISCQEIVVVFYEELISFEYIIGRELDIKSYFDFVQYEYSEDAKNDCLASLDMKIRSAYMEEFIDSQILKH